MSRLDSYGGVIFDMDGTLADSMQVWDSICRDWAVARGFAPPDELETNIELMTLEESARYVIELFGLDETTGQIQSQWSGMVLRRYRERVKPKEGAARLLETLWQEGIPMGLATSGFPDACEGFLQSNGLRQYFRAVTYTHEAGRDKTYPDVYLACAEALGVAPDRCAVVEDLPAALSGVKAAGMDFVAVYDEATLDWEGLAAKADIAVRSLTELL